MQAGGQAAKKAPYLQKQTPPSSRPAKKSAATGFDVIMLMLGIIAIIAVLGLVPLFVAVLSAYAPTLFSDSPASASEAASGEVIMPDLVGLEETAAQTAVESMNMKLVVDGQEPHPTWSAFTVIRQSVPAGTVIGGDTTTVNVVLSQGPAMVEMPDVTGMRYNEAEQLLTSLGLVVQKYEDWSPETPGLVVLQDVPPGSLIENRTLITLVVSSGSRTPVGASFGGQIALNAYELPRLQYNPGEFIGLTFFWQSIALPTSNYNLYIHFTTPQGGIVSEIDMPPQIGPTTSWPVGQVIVDTYNVPIPPTVVAGDYQIRIGFYDPRTNTRLPITEPGRVEPDNLGSLILRNVQIIQ
jgi:serine/threonine-protein kinase